MSIQDILTSDLITYAAYLPGIGAVLLSLYNWYQMRRGAVIKLNQSVNYGLIRDEEKTEAFKFYFPILTYNEGSKAGMITDITVSFKSLTSEKRIDISRRVEMIHEEGTDEEDTSIVGLEPSFPFFVPADEGNVTIFECVDYDHDVIPLNQLLTCKISLQYDRKKKSFIEFPFQLNSEEISLLLQGTMKWLKPAVQVASPGVVTDRDHLKMMLEELNLEDKFEAIIESDGTHFDRTVKYNGTKFVRLDLSELKIAVLPESIKNFELLEYLDLGNNLLTTLPESIGELQNLKEIELRINKGLVALPDSIGQLKNLKFLGLNGGKLSRLPDTIGNLKSLEWLRISSNQFQILPENLKGLKNLVRLDLENNQLENLPDIFDSLQKLTTLNVYKNKIKTVPPSLLHVKKFVQLEFKENSITELPPNLIQDGEHITGLFFNDNNIDILPEGLEKLERLSTISIRNNPLSSLSEPVKTSLQTLKERGCNVYIE